MNPGARLHKLAKEIVSHFAEFLRVDLQLSEATVKEHVFEIKRFLAWLNEQEVDLKDVSRTTIRGYLKRLEGYSTSTYANVLKSLKRFLRDVNQRPCPSVCSSSVLRYYGSSTSSSLES